VIKLTAIVDRGLAHVIAVPNKIGPCRHGLHCSKLSIAGCTVTFIDLIDGPLEGFSDFGRDVLKGDCAIVNKGHYKLSIERRPEAALSNAINAIKGQVGDCWLIRINKLDLVRRALGYCLSIAVTSVKFSMQVAMSSVILQSFVVPQESVW
jgi:hypothetical protein